MAGVRKKATKGGLYQGYFTNYLGIRQYLTAATKKKALEEASTLEKQHREIRQGFRPPPNSVERHRKSTYEDISKEYLNWGESQGGRKGRPWSVGHAKRRNAQLVWWREQLGLSCLADLEGMLPRVEKELRALQDQGKAGKTIANYAEGLAAFCDWCVQRGFLAEDPLKGLAPFDTTPQVLRRAMTHQEITQLLQVPPHHRRLLYETAFVSGLRANELRNLTVDHLDLERSGLLLDAEWTKNRKPGFQPLPRALVERLQAFVETGEAKRIYEANYKKAKAKKPLPDRPLLYVPSQTDRWLTKDLEKAQIPKETPKGKLDFHACRVAFINMVMEMGQVTPKEVQELARHSTLDLTMNVYGRVRDQRLADAVERIGEAIIEEKSVPDVYRQAVGAERESATFVKIEGCASKELVAGVGFEPTTFGL